MGKKTRRLLATITTGGILATLAVLCVTQDRTRPTCPTQPVSLHNPAEHKHMHNFAIPATQKMPIRMFYDTISTNSFALNKQKNIRGGTYFRRKNSVRVIYYRDTLPESKYPQKMRKISDINERFKYVEYHEIRHAQNNYFIGRTPDQTPALHIANEFWARTAEALARYCNMPHIRTPKTNMDITYRLIGTRIRNMWDYADITNMSPENYTLYVYYPYNEQLRAAADSALIYALTTFNKSFNLYIDFLTDIDYDTYRISCAQNAGNQIPARATQDSLRVFKIDGRRVDLFAVASDSVRTQVEKFLNEIAPARLRAATEKSR